MESLEKNNNNEISLTEQVDNVIKDLEYKLFNLMHTENGKMKLKNFKKLPQVKEIMTTIKLLKKIYKKD